MNEFADAIIQFNHIFRLRHAPVPTLHRDTGTLLNQLKSHLLEQIGKLDDLVVTGYHEKDRVLMLAYIADLLATFMVETASTMVQFGLPMNDVLMILMRSHIKHQGDLGEALPELRRLVSSLSIASTTT